MFVRITVNLPDTVDNTVDVVVAAAAVAAAVVLVDIVAVAERKGCMAVVAVHVNWRLD